MALRATLGAWVTVGLMACGPAIPEDGFSQQITARCATAGGCEEALKDANARAASCKAKGGDCIWVNEDLASVQRLNKRHVDESQARAARAAQPAPTAAPTSSAVAASLAAVPMSEHESVLRTALADCKATAKLERCTEGASPAEQAKCEDECKKFGAQRSDDLFKGQLRACAEAAVADPKATQCATDGRVWAPKERLGECSKKCAALGPKLRAYDAARVKCCDGTRSATCTNAMHGAECCAANGGVCQEPKPTE
ncbi:MAG TPA: hypothetical protein PK141_01445 [Polyangiaceae bacterium]|nr:hypothetical protein [Polyangiaceae bacterium]